ncbi:unnamed protein product [Lota lota]
MASVVHCASCYGQSSVQPLQLFGRGPGLDYMSMLTYRGPRCVPHPRLAYHSPRMTLRQICRTLKIMKQLRAREAAIIPGRKQGSAVAATSAVPEKRCLPSCLRRRWNNNIKRAS